MRMVSKEEFLHLFDRFALLICQPDVKQRIVDAVNHKQEAVAITTAIQEEIFSEIGIVEPSCLVIVSKKRCQRPVLQMELRLSCRFVTTRFCKPSSCIVLAADNPQFGLACLGKINMTYESDRDLMIRFYEFVAKEEMACEEAELGPDRFAERLRMQQNLQEQQLEMLKYMRRFHMDDQSAILEKIHQQSNKANFETGASVLTVEQMQDVVITFVPA
ncbi:hypothetical protein H5410_014564 [Solanum commersonii]|uniref:Uncharacterized protein n=1 Tax=Solanum commersonii TaxID=4109 RepID=A0A9J5ZRS4_SOLCO|nr:hypothetical protein H5410_014564 [Solanum commersonii]